jgi:hypothetical protein
VFWTETTPRPRWRLFTTWTARAVERNPHVYEGLSLIVGKDIWPCPGPVASVAGMGEAVVVVEHEEPTREFLARQLADDGFEVFATDRAAAALALVEERRQDLVLLDAVLPDRKELMSSSDEWDHLERAPAAVRRTRDPQLVEPGRVTGHGTTGADRSVSVLELRFRSQDSARRVWTRNADTALTCSGTASRLQPSPAHKGRYAASCPLWGRSQQASAVRSQLPLGLSYRRT